MEKKNNYFEVYIDKYLAKLRECLRENKGLTVSKFKNFFQINKIFFQFILSFIINNF